MYLNPERLRNLGEPLQLLPLARGQPADLDPAVVEDRHEVTAGGALGVDPVTALPAALQR